MFEWLKQILGNWGLAKDAMTNPGETGGEVAQSIIERLNPALQRIVVLILIIIALVMGANIGIDYERSQMTIQATPPAKESSVNPNPPPAENIKAVEVWTPALEPILLPEAKTPVNFTKPRQAAKPSLGATQKAVQTRKRPSGIRHSQKLNRPVRSYTAREKLNHYKVWQGLPKREMTTSGPGGY
jgi:hypothetical protein